MNPIHFDVKMNVEGFAVLENIVPMPLIQRMRDELDFANEVCRRAQRDAGLENTEGTVHHLPAIEGRRAFLEFLEENPSAKYVSRFFGGRPYVLQSMGGNFNFPEGQNYASAVHRDIRSFWGERLMLNTLVALDDLTTENGATWLLPGGHLMEEKPLDHDFDSIATQVTAPAGSILMWDSRLWHKAGINRTRYTRRIVTPIFTRPFYKAGFDYPRAIGYERMEGMSHELQQVLGYYARTPATFKEWYRKPEERLYRRGQG